MKTTGMSGRMRLLISLLAIQAGFCAFAQESEERPWHERERPTPDEIHEFLEDNLPERAEEMKRLNEKEPEAYRHEIMMIGEMVMRYREMMEHNPELAEAFIRSHKMETECNRLAEEIRETEDLEKQRVLRSKLKQLLAEVFDLRLKEPEMHIQNLEKEINEMKGMIERRKANKDKIIQRRLKEMTGERNDLDWW